MNKRDNDTLGECDLKEEKRRRNEANKSKKAREKRKSKGIFDQIELSRANCQISALQNEVSSLRSKIALMTHGFARDQMDPHQFESLRTVVFQMQTQSVGAITGKYMMSAIDPKDLNDSAKEYLLSFEKLAQFYLSWRFGVDDITVEMDESAVLVNPEPAGGQSEKAQISHADDISGTGVTFIISLSDNCLSTHCLPTKFYGPEYPRTFTADRLIRCDYLTKTQANADIISAVRARYRPVCSLSPSRFFDQADGGQPVPAGHFTAFRHDIMHAGPSGNHARQVLFLHFRVKSDQKKPQHDIQYRIDTLMAVCGFTAKERKKIYDQWVNAGHWSPQDSA